MSWATSTKPRRTSRIFALIQAADTAGRTITLQELVAMTGEDRFAIRGAIEGLVTAGRVVSAGTATYALSAVEKPKPKASPKMASYQSSFIRPLTPQQMMVRKAGGVL